MPCKVRIYIAGEQTAEPFEHINGQRALFYKWIENSQPSVSQQLHDINKCKPLYLTPLHQMTCKEHYYYDISCPSNWLAELIAENVPPPGSLINFGRSQYHIAAEPEIHSQMEWTQFLEQCSKEPDGWDIICYTPTANHMQTQSGIRKAIVAPSPEMYFANWLRKWNLGSPFAIDESILDIVSNNIALSRFAGGTQTVRIDKTRNFIGFTGECSFTILDRSLITQSQLYSLNTLAAYSNYAGTGVENMRGMGITYAAPFFKKRHINQKT